MRDASWKGKLEKRFRWSVFGWRWGRWCYRTNALGETLDSWFEWETESPSQSSGQ
jgi:hypothetical protein